jgi:D-alanyl-D-alanine carboxypeptidase/D-alanyl-D-alanine-endopeptidase (penicillin-binding protein 4)
MMKLKASYRFATALLFLTLLVAINPTARAQSNTPTNQQTTPPVNVPSQQPYTFPTPVVVPPLDETPLAGSQGLLVETLDGRKVTEAAADQAFNPASAVKLATALTALRTFGPQYRFTTAVWTNGTFDKATGTITGDLYISGRDPSFHYEHAVQIARELNRQGVRTVTGDLIVAPRFTMNFDSSTQRSGEQLYDTLDATRRNAAATQAMRDSLLLNSERMIAGNNMIIGSETVALSAPSVAVMGAVYVDSVPREARTLLVHRSSQLVDVLKVLLCYSNNFMAERIGDTLGGPESVRRTLISSAGVPSWNVSLASTSGLGVNRVTPRAMMKVLRALRDELAKNHLELSDILPVAGVDPGTLRKRYTTYPSRGSVIAKTGTLTRTDGGASALVGEMHTTTNETLLFVIFNQRGSVVRFRENQDRLVTQIQNSHGGPASFVYRPLALAMRLADTETGAVSSARKDEYEPASN